MKGLAFLARFASRHTSYQRLIRRAIVVVCSASALTTGLLGLTACTTSGNPTVTSTGTPAPTTIPTLTIVTPTPPVAGQSAPTAGADSAAPTAAATQQTNNGANGTYTVQAGDTLYTIAVKFNVTVQALMSANSISDPTTLMAGQVIVIP